MRRMGVLGAGLVIVGAVGMIAAVLADLGRWPYYGGAAVLVIGLALLLTGVLRHRAAFVAACLAIAVVVGGGAWLGLNGLPEQHPAWPEEGGSVDYHVTGDAARLGDLWLTGAAAYDMSTGNVRWTSWGTGAPPDEVEDIRLIAVTSTTVVSFEPSTQDRYSGQLVARAPTDGTEQWSVPADSSRGSAVDGHVLVTSASTSGTVAYDLRTGHEVWSDDRESGPQCHLGQLRQTNAPAPTQAVVALVRTEWSDDLTAQNAIVRVSDGKAVIDKTRCSGAVRVAGDVVIDSDGNQVIGRSTTDGSILWRVPQARELPNRYNLSGSGTSVYTPGSNATGIIPRYFGIDVTTGKVTQTSPPQGWRVVRDETRRQVGEHVWQPVAREGGGLGMWELGTDRVVAIPGPRIFRSIETDPTSGWLVVTGHVEDPVGDEHNTAWALSPEGDLSGPFRGRSAYVEEGLIMVDGVVHPLD